MRDISLQEMIRFLPPELRNEVRDFAAFLVYRQRKKSKGKMEFRWQGTLKDLRELYTSVELQHKISENL